MSNSRMGPGGVKLAHVDMLEPIAETTALYAKSNGKLYIKSYGGNESAIGGFVSAGAAFPSPSEGDLYYKTGEGLYRYNGSIWDLAVVKAPELTIQPTSDGVVFTIKNATGSDTVLSVDTTTGNVVVNGDLEVNGRVICKLGITNIS